MSVRFPYSPTKNPPIPAVVVTLWSPDGLRSIDSVSAYLDTAADRSVVPLSLVQRLGLQPRGRVVGLGLGSIS